MSLLAPADRTPVRFAANLDCRRVREDLWRVSDPGGVALGYVAASRTAQGTAFEARRLMPGGTTLVPIGSAWRLEDALACFRIA